MDQVQPSLRVRCGVNFQTGAGQNEIHKLEILRVIIDNHQPHGRRVSACGAHYDLTTATKAFSTCRISSSLVKGFRRIAVPCSKIPCVAISPSVYPDMYNTLMPGRSANSTSANFLPLIPGMMTSVKRRSMAPR